jgi:hypothetical protein
MARHFLAHDDLNAFFALFGVQALACLADAIIAIEAQARVKAGQCQSRTTETSSPPHDTSPAAGLPPSIRRMSIRRIQIFRTAKTPKDAKKSEMSCHDYRIFTIKPGVASSRPRLPTPAFRADAMIATAAAILHCMPLRLLSVED